MIEFAIESENLLSIIGCAFDVAGATLLARALFWIGARQLWDQGTSGYGGVSGHLIKMFSEQQVDATFGLGLLIVGFVIQGFAGYGFRSTELTVLYGGIGLLAAVLVAYFTFRPVLARRRFIAAYRTRLHPTEGTPVWTDQHIIEEFWNKL